MTNGNTNKMTARLVAVATGIALLVMAAAAFYVTAILWRLQVFRDIDQHQHLRQLLKYSVSGWLLILIADVLVAWGLFVLLRKIDERISLLTAWLRLMYTVFLGIAIADLVLCLLLLNDSNSIYAAGESQSPGLMIIVLIKGFKEVWSLGLILFGLHLLGLGYLALRSGFIPRFLGVLLVLAAPGYIITNTGSLVSSDFENYKTYVEMTFMLPMILGETGLAVWLILKGGRAVHTR